MIDVFTVNGVRDNGYLLSRVTDRLDAAKFNRGPAMTIAYPASVGPANIDENPLGASLTESLFLGTRELARRIAATDNLAIVGGYSLGAYVVSVFLADLARGEAYTHNLEVIGAFTVANPQFAGAYGAPGFGIAGKHATWPSIPIFEIWNPADGICCTPQESPLRTLSGFVHPLTFALGGGWGRDLLDDLRTGRYQPWRDAGRWLRNPIAAASEWDLAYRLLRGYLFDHQHDWWYWEDHDFGNPVEILGDTVNNFAWPV